MGKACHRYCGCVGEDFVDCVFEMDEVIGRCKGRVECTCFLWSLGESTWGHGWSGWGRECHWGFPGARPTTSTKETKGGAMRAPSTLVPDHQNVGYEGFSKSTPAPRRCQRRSALRAVCSSAIPTKATLQMLQRSSGFAFENFI